MRERQHIVVLEKGPELSFTAKQITSILLVKILFIKFKSPIWGIRFFLSCEIQLLIQ